MDCPPSDNETAAQEEPEQARTCKRPYETGQAGQESIDPQRDPLKGESRYGEEAPTGKLHVVGGPAAAAGGEQAFRRAHGDFGQAGPGGRQGPACHLGEVPVLQEGVGRVRIKEVEKNNLKFSRRSSTELLLGAIEADRHRQHLSVLYY